MWPEPITDRFDQPRASHLGSNFEISEKKAKLFNLYQPVLQYEKYESPRIQPKRKIKKNISPKLKQLCIDEQQVSKIALDKRNDFESPFRKTSYWSPKSPVVQ